MTNFEKWKKILTPEDIADNFMILSCRDCPANGVSCTKYDTNCQEIFFSWARSEYKEAKYDE